MEICSVKEFNETFNNIMIKGNINLNLINPEPYSNGIITFIYKFLNIYIKNDSFKKNKIYRFIKYLNKQFRKASLAMNKKYKIKNHKMVKSIILLIYIMIFRYHITINKDTNIISAKKYLIFKKIYTLIRNISAIISKFYLDKIMDIIELQVILKTLIIFTVNDKYEDIKENNDIKNLMYFNECLNILHMIFNKKNNEIEQNFLINIFNYINNKICFRGKKNENINYTNKIYMIHNDYKTTKLIKRLDFIHKVNNNDLTKIYFEFLCNIYYFQFDYNNLTWQFYELLEPLLGNIKEKNYEILLKEISFSEFQFNFIKELFSKERNFIKDNIFIFKNAFYMSGKQQNSGIIADIGKIQSQFLLTFGFNFIITDVEKEEYIIFQIKNYEQKLQLKALISKDNNKKYFLELIYSSFNKDNKCWKIQINPNHYYCFVLIIEKGKHVNISFFKENTFYEEKFTIKEMRTTNLFLAVGCEVEKIDKKLNSIHNNYKIINSYTGFIGDIFMIDLNLYKEKFSLQKNILKLKGKYGHTLIRSLWEQKSLDEYITSNLEKITINRLELDDEPSIFKTMSFSKGKFKIIDNIDVNINPTNFRLIDYLDNIDYMNYDNKYHQKEKLLSQPKKEKQFYNNFRTKEKGNNNNKIIEIGTSLFNCNFNYVENTSGLIKFVEEDGIFYMLLIFEYYYQILFRISKDALSYDNNIVLSKEHIEILKSIEKGIENIVEFFLKKIIDTNFNIKYYKIILFFYQMNVVIKQFLLLKTINNNIYHLLIKFLDRYQTSLDDYIITNLDEKIKYFRDVRNFFFDFLLNPRFYKQNEQFDLLNNINAFLELVFKIVQKNILNEEILTENIFEKILNLAFILILKDDTKEEKKLNNNGSSFKKIKVRYLFFLIKYIEFLYSENNDTHKISNIINVFCNKLINYKEEPIIFYYLSLAFFISGIVFEIQENFINKLTLIFEENYTGANIENKIYSISSMLILNSYYLIYNKNEVEKINKFKTWYSQLSPNIAYIYFENIYKIIIGGVYGINEVLDIAKNFKEDVLENDLNINKLFLKNRVKEISHLLIQQNIYTPMASFAGYETISKNTIIKENDLENNNIINDDKERLKDSIRKKNIKVNIKVDTEIAEEEIIKIKNNLNKEKYYNNYYSFLDDIKRRCFIYNPKNILIKRFFSHIFYRSLFHCKAFMIIKNKYLNLFPKANIENKQLNYPSKIKNFSNIYESKLFLRKNFNFYNTKYFPITHDFLIKDPPKFKFINEEKKRSLESLLKANISNINFYEHRLNINEILEDKERYFDCELINPQYTYFGFLILGNYYLYFGTKDEERIDLKDPNIEEIDINYISRFGFSNQYKYNKSTKKKKIILFYQDIKTIIKRRSFLMYQSFEVFCQNGKSYFFNLFRKENCENAFKILSSINETLRERDKFELINENIAKDVKKLINDVKNGTINNYSYLLKLNYFSSRTFNDVSQYPIFPWLFLDINKINAIFNVVKSNLEKTETITSTSEIEENQEENKEIIDIDKLESKSSKKINEELSQKLQLRNFSYPISLQTEEQRKIYIKSNYTPHGNHYSTASYLFFYLNRNYPFAESIIELQNMYKENANRLFVSMEQSLKILSGRFENREALPEIFSCFDFYCNLNCIFLGIQGDGTLVDDFKPNKRLDIITNFGSIYCKYIYMYRKLLNSLLISKFLPNWIDFIFGVKQIEKSKESFYIFEKLSYEEKLKLDKKLSKYIKKYQNNEGLTNIELRKKLTDKIDFLNNFGIVPHKILNGSVKLNTSIKIKNSVDEILEINENIFFSKINENILILYKNQKNVDKEKNIILWNANIIKNKAFDKKNTFNCGYIKQLQKITIDNASIKIPIYKPCYSMCQFIILNKIFIATCRYLGNIFKIQNSDYCIDVFCEDFVSCITCKKDKDSSKYNNVIIYTGLKNGKLIEWFVSEILNDYGKINIKERNNYHCHKGEITCIEIYKNQNVIITGGEDKMIFIRKIYDFELLTAINLTYCYMNPIISQKIDIIPTLIRVSELNFIYVLLFNFNTCKSFIRGYNLNGLFFVQSEEDYYINICFTKNSNLLVSNYNKDQINILNCYDLKLINFSINLNKFVENIEKSHKKKKNKENDDKNFLVWNEYESNNHELILLFKNKIVRGNIRDKEEQMNLEYY